MRLLFLLLVLSLGFNCRRQPVDSELNFRDVLDYTFSERETECLDFKAGGAWFLVCELYSLVDSLNHQRSIFAKIDLSSSGKAHLSERVVESHRVSNILDSLGVGETSVQSVECRGMAVDEIQGSFFQKSYSIPLSENRNISARILGKDQQSEVQFLSRGKVMQGFAIPDAPNYVVKTIDINGDQVNEILVFSAAMNGSVHLKVFRVDIFN